MDPCDKILKLVNAAVPVPRSSGSRGPRGLSLSMNNLDLLQENEFENRGKTLATSMENLRAIQTPNPVSILKKRHANANTCGLRLRTGKRIRFALDEENWDSTASKSMVCVRAAEVNVSMENARTFRNRDVVPAKANSMPNLSNNIEPRIPSTLTRLARTYGMDTSKPYVDKNTWNALFQPRPPHPDVLGERNARKPKINP